MAQASNNKTKYVFLLIFLLALANFFVFREVFKIDGLLKVTFFDVGQGDSIMIETPQTHQILIDGGPDGRVVLEKLSNKMPFWDKTIDLVILTHPDYDHLRGLIDVLERYEVKNILWTGAVKDSATLQKWLIAIEQERADVVVAEKGQVVKAGNVLMYILYPFENIAGAIPRDSNDTSIVAKLVFGENSFFFPGDASNKVEDQLLARSDFAVSLASDILKVAHHGSKYSTSLQFLDIANPFLAVISCGLNNSYGHPHQETLSNLENFAIKVLRTDIIGDVFISSDGKNININ